MSQPAPKASSSFSRFAFYAARLLFKAGSNEMDSFKTGKGFVPCPLSRTARGVSPLPQGESRWRGVCNVFLKIKTFARADCPFLPLLICADFVYGQFQKRAQRGIFGMESTAIGGIIQRGLREPALLIARENIAIAL